MHLDLDAASAVVSAPPSPDRTPEVFRGLQGLVARHGTLGAGLPGFGVPARWNDGMRPAVGDGIMAVARVVGTICRDASDLLIGQDLIKQFGKHRRVSDMATSDLDGPNLQCLLVHPEVYLAPDAVFRPIMLACMPLAFSLDLDTRAVDQQVKRPTEAAIGNVHGQRLLAAAERAEVGHRPVEADQAQQAFDEPGRQAQCHAEPARGFARSGLKRATGAFSGRPSPFIVRHVWIAVSL